MTIMQALRVQRIVQQDGRASYAAGPVASLDTCEQSGQSFAVGGPWSVEVQRAPGTRRSSGLTPRSPGIALDIEEAKVRFQRGSVMAAHADLIRLWQDRATRRALEAQESN
ncbi:MAG TPA: hypothetical protein VHT91_30420 [Kofleriaceae bacterium]|jgi:hypothetical protein|nr:hypothetical protein [Kofleriaceae bacterium]